MLKRVQYLKKIMKINGEDNKMMKSNKFMTKNTFKPFLNMQYILGQKIKESKIPINQHSV